MQMLVQISKNNNSHKIQNCQPMDPNLKSSHLIKLFIGDLAILSAANLHWKLNYYWIPCLNYDKFEEKIIFTLLDFLKPRCSPWDSKFSPLELSQELKLRVADCLMHLTPACTQISSSLRVGVTKIMMIIAKLSHPASIGWVALSSLVRRSSSVRPASVTSPLISTIWCSRPYKPYIFC